MTDRKILGGLRRRYGKLKQDGAGSPPDYQFFPEWRAVV